MENNCQCKEAKIDMYNSLSSTLEKKVAPLRGRQVEIDKRLAELADNKREGILQAQIGVISRQ